MSVGCSGGASSEAYRRGGVDDLDEETGREERGRERVLAKEDWTVEGIEEGGGAQRKGGWSGRSGKGEAADESGE